MWNTWGSQHQRIFATLCLHIHYPTTSYERYMCSSVQVFSISFYPRPFQIPYNRLLINLSNIFFFKKLKFFPKLLIVFIEAIFAKLETSNFKSYRSQMFCFISHLLNSNQIPDTPNRKYMKFSRFLRHFIVRIKVKWIKISRFKVVFFNDLHRDV